MYSDMSTRNIAALVVEEELGERARELGLADAGRAEEQERTDRTVRIGKPGPRTADRVGHRGHCRVLADHALVQHLFEAHELRELAFHQPRDRDPGPLGDDLGDVLLVDLFLQHRAVALELAESRGHGLELALDHGNVAVAQLGRALEITVTLGPFRVEARLLEAFLAGLNRRDRIFLGLPVHDHAVAVFAQRLQLVVERLEPLLARVVGLLGQRGPLDLELADAPLDHVDLERHRVDLDPQPRRGFVDEVDRLVRKLAPGDVAIRQDRRRDQAPRPGSARRDEPRTAP